MDGEPPLAAQWAVSEAEKNLSRARLQRTLWKDILANFDILVATFETKLHRLPDQSSTSALEQYSLFLLDEHQAMVDHLAASLDDPDAADLSPVEALGGTHDEPAWS